jgi:acyl-CoA hydrolase
VLVAYADGIDGARSGPVDVAALAGLSGPQGLAGLEVLLGWTPEERPWLGWPDLRGCTVIPGYALAGAVADGRLRYLPVRLSAVPGLVAELRPDIAVVSAIRRGDRLAFGASVGWGPAAARAATAVVVEVDEDAPDLGAPVIPGNIVATVPRPAARERAPRPRRPDEVDLAIGRHVVSLLPHDPTLQLGVGGVAEAVVACLDRPVRVWSGLVTDAVAHLAERELLRGQVTAAYARGGEPLARLAAAGLLRLVPIEETHDLTRVSSIERFFGCNTALQVGLDGSVNVERAGPRLVTGIGGHADFAVAAARSPGGASVIALRSTTPSGASTIVPRVDVVSTPRTDVGVVVTEHGTADLRGLDDPARARRIATIAAPQHRAALVEAAVEAWR